MLTSACLYFYALLVCAIALFWAYSTSTFGYWRKRRIFYLKPTPFFGNMLPLLTLRQSMHEMLDRLYTLADKLPLCGFFDMRTPVLLVKDRELITAILVTDFKHFTDRGFDFWYVNKKLNPLSCSLFVSCGQRWRWLRQHMSAAFTRRKIAEMHPQVLACLSQLIDHLETGMSDETGKDVNLKETFNLFSIDVIGTTAFGLEFRSLKADSVFREIALETLKPTVSSFLRMLAGTVSTKLLKVFRLTDFPIRITSYFQNVVFDAVLHRRENNVTRDDILQRMMDMKNYAVDSKFSVGHQNAELPENEIFDEIDIAANAFTFFLAGFETTATALGYCVYELALNREIQDRLRAEVLQVRQLNGDEFSVDSLKEMTYMDAVISETLRKYPPNPVLYRQCVEDYEMPKVGLQIKRGDKMYIPVWSLHHDSRHYPQPEVFDPERFNSVNKQSRPAGTFIPFGVGPRYCMGEQFAFMEMN